MWVRMRNEKDGLAIRDLVPELQDREILHYKNRDYEWRFSVSRDEMHELMGAVVANLSYTNFKNRATKTTPHNKAALWGVYQATYDATDIYVKPEPDLDKYWEEPKLFGDEYYANGPYDDEATVDNTNYVDPPEGRVLEKFADWLRG